MGLMRDVSTLSITCVRNTLLSIPIADIKCDKDQYERFLCLSYLNVRPRPEEDEIDAVMLVERVVRREAVAGVAVSVELGLLARALTMHLSIIPYGNSDLTIFTLIKR